MNGWVRMLARMPRDIQFIIAAACTSALIGLGARELETDVSDRASRYGVNG